MLSTCMGYVGFIFWVICCCELVVESSKRWHVLPKAAMMAAPAMHASVRMSVFFIGAFYSTIAVDYFSPKLEFIIKNYSKLLETGNKANYAN